MSQLEGIPISDILPWMRRSINPTDLRAVEEIERMQATLAWLDAQIEGTKPQAQMLGHERPQIEARARVIALQEARAMLLGLRTWP